MLIKNSIVGFAITVALWAASASALADQLVVNLAGWKTYGGFGSTLNTSSFFSLPAAASINGYSYAGLTFSASNGSFLNEFVLSVNNFNGSAYMDWSPSITAAAGTFGPAGGTWGGTNGSGVGTAFLLTPGANNLWVTVYETVDDPFGDTGLVLDATVSAGTLTISYTSPIPEPASSGLMGLGLGLGLFARAATARRRQA